MSQDKETSNTPKTTVHSPAPTAAPPPTRGVRVVTGIRAGHNNPIYAGAGHSLTNPLSKA